jgi:hypothetical protein
VTDLPDFDWKSSSVLAGLALASIGAARKIVTPFLVKQVQEAVGDPLRKISEQLLALQIGQDSDRDVMSKFNERLSYLEGIIERRRKPRA